VYCIYNIGHTICLYKEVKFMVQENLARAFNAEKQENLRFIRCAKSFCVRLFRWKKE